MVTPEPNYSKKILKQEKVETKKKIKEKEKEIEHRESGELFPDNEEKIDEETQD